MILLDTNVLSELLKPAPEPKVTIWLDSLTAADVYICAITQAELLYGIEILPAGQRRQRLESAVAELLNTDFTGRILPFDSAAASSYATITATRRRLGRPIDRSDAQIASIALANHATLATRNVADFQKCGILILDPWNM